MADDLNFFPEPKPEPEPEPEPESELELEPVSEPGPNPFVPSQEQVPALNPALPKTALLLELNKKPILYGVILGILLFLSGGILGGVWIYYHNTFRQKYLLTQEQLQKAQTEIKRLQNDLEKSHIDLSNVRLGLSQYNKLFGEQTAPPSKPEYIKLDKGVLIYWTDGMIRRSYFLYKGKGYRGTLNKTTRRPTRLNFVYLPVVPPGVWCYAVTALDREGKETALSETLVLTN